MATFGQTTKGGSNYSVSTNILMGSLFTLTKPAIPTAIVFYLYRVATGTPINTKFAVYDDTGAGTDPGALMCYTEETSFDGVDAWTKLDTIWYEDAERILATGDYYIAMWSSGAAFTVYGSATGRWEDKSEAYNGFPDPFPAAPTNQTREISCYCEYMTLRTEYPTIKKRFEQSGLSTVVTRGALSLGSQNGTTGWYAPTYTETDIEMFVFPKSAQRLALECGTYVNSDAVGLTRHLVKFGDRVRTFNAINYEVETVKPWTVGDTFSHFECDLRELPLV